jgi:RNA polymerase sigma-70 factor, ECF subfamily
MANFREIMIVHTPVVTDERTSGGWIGWMPAKMSPATKAAKPLQRMRLDAVTFILLPPFDDCGLAIGVHVFVSFLLVRGLRAALGGQANRAESSVEDFAQEALIKILSNLDTFRGESRFTTWAHKICVRTAFAEMRRSRWRDVSLDEVLSQPEHSAAADPQLDPERAATQSMIMERSRRFIDEELTDRQRTALLAALGGMPLEAIADRMNTNRNAPYKLLHDARKRLRPRMSAEMLSPQDVLGAFGDGQVLFGLAHLVEERQCSAEPSSRR